MLWELLQEILQEMLPKCYGKSYGTIGYFTPFTGITIHTERPIMSAPHTDENGLKN